MVGCLAGTGLPDGEDADSLFLGNVEDIQVSVLDGQVGNYVQWIVTPGENDETSNLGPRAFARYIGPLGWGGSKYLAYCLVSNKEFL